LIIYCFTSRSRIFQLYGDVTIAEEGLQNLGLCSALRAFEQDTTSPNKQAKQQQQQHTNKQTNKKNQKTNKTKTQQCHEIEANPLKDRAMHEGDNPSL
jgi:hypothetical protein